MSMSYPSGYFTELRKKYSNNKISKYIKISTNTSLLGPGTCGIANYINYPQCLIQGNESEMYHSEKSKIAKIVFDMNSPFILTGFAIKAITASCCWLQSYSFKGSDDNQNWNQIIYNNNYDLKNDNDNWHYYPVNVSKYRYFGIFQDPDSNKAYCADYYFVLHAIDLTGFATLIFNKGNTCKQRAETFKLNVFALVLLTK